MRQKLFIPIFLMLISIFCSPKHKDEAINLSVCDNDDSCSTNLTDSSTGFETVKCRISINEFIEPCFSSSSKDTILFKWSAVSATHSTLELLNDDEDILSILYDNGIPPGYFSIAWENDKHKEIIGARLSMNHYSKTYWFYTN